MTAMKTLAEIDRNLAVSTSFGRDDVVLFDPRTPPFSLYGVFYEDGAYRRLPDAIAASVSEGVHALAPCTAGGRACFSTDSDFVAISCRRPDIAHLPHMALTGSSGFDLYVRTNGKITYASTFKPDLQKPEGYDSILYFPSHQQREVIIHFPSYCGITSLQIGIQKDASLGAWNGYRISTPVVFYGSSITQGACASTPGNDYIGRLSRRFDFDYINLGFSGNAKAEPAIMKYIAGLSMSAFVYDYDHNAPDAEYLAKTHFDGYQRFRSAQPDTPVIMASKVDYYADIVSNEKRREIILESYRRGLEAGDRHLYFVDGKTIYDPDYLNESTADGCHPNDAGYLAMAKTIGETVKKAMSESKHSL